MLSQIGLVILLALLNGFFALSEIALIASRRSRLKQGARNSVQLRAALHLVENTDRMLSTVQVGITLIGIVIGAATGASIGSIAGSWLQDTGVAWLAPYAMPAGMVISVVLVTFINIIIGELVPKRIALVAPEKIATRIAVPMLVIARIATPAVFVLNATSTGILRLLRLHNKRSADTSEEEIRLMVAESTEQGVLDEDERNMVNRVLRLGDRDAESVMTPRNRIVWVDADAPLHKNLAILATASCSRFPVYRGDTSDILGILEVKTLMQDLANSQYGGQDDAGVTNGSWQNIDLFEHLAKPLYVPATARALDLLEEFRRAETGLALVVDEYGDIDGVVTINDLLGTVVGHIASSEAENPHGEAPVTQREDGSYLVDGALPGDDLRELLGSSHLPFEEEHEFNTVAGLLMAAFGRIPQPGENFTEDGHYFELIKRDGPRIDKVLVHPAADDAKRTPPD